MREAWTTRQLLPSEAAIVHHPDRRGCWVPCVRVELAEPLTTPVIGDRLTELAARHSILGARLDSRRGAWVAGSPRLPIVPLPDPLAVLCVPIDLATGPPLRVALSADGRQLAVAGHHAALDGRALLMVARALLGAPAGAAEAPLGSVAPPRAPGAAPAAPASAPRSAPQEALARVLRPADRVAPSRTGRGLEVLLAAEAPVGAELRVAALAAAAVRAAGAWNHRRRRPWRRVGLTIPVGGPPLLGNVASHRRLDLDLPADVAAAVTAALAQGAAPPDAGLDPRRARLLRLLAPVVARLSDSLLVSNLGLVDLPGATAVDFYPQARGRSAVALGACTVRGGRSRLTLRARDLNAADAEALLQRWVAELSPAG